MENLDKTQTWKDTLEALKVSVSSATFSTWLAHTHLSDVKEVGKRAIAEIGCNSIFIKNQVESRYQGLIADTLSQILEKTCDITFVVKSPTANNLPKIEDKPAPLFDQPELDKAQFALALKRANLRIGYTFDKFAVSGSNQMAHAAAEAVSNTLGTAYNPLFMWGGVGVGKTHLMHAVGYTALLKNMDSKVVACTAEDFTNDIVEGIRSKTTPEVRKKYRRLDALLIDDIQFIAGKDTAQEEFFHTFNAVTSAGGQVILTSDRPPSEISKLEARLRSRFEAGLIVDISEPDFELRCAITQIKAEERGMKLDADIAALIAGNINSAREIQGFIVKLFTQVNFKGAQIDPDLIQSLLGKSADTGDRVIKANPIDVISTISKYYSIKKRDLLGESRARPIARPRQVLMYILKTQLGLPLEEVGRLVGGRDHTTVMHAVDKITQLASESGDIRGDIEGIKKTL
jgi:chromosomal replication initiator protein